MGWDPDDIKKSRVKRENQYAQWEKYLESVDEVEKGNEKEAKKDLDPPNETDQKIQDLAKNRIPKNYLKDQK